MHLSSPHACWQTGFWLDIFCSFQSNKHDTIAPGPGPVEIVDRSKIRSFEEEDANTFARDSMKAAVLQIIVMEIQELYALSQSVRDGFRSS